MIRVRKVMCFSQLPSENNSFLQTENPKCYTDTAVAEALQPITKREEFSMSQKKRKPNEFTIRYKAMVTDYLLYEDCCDYHLKLILAVWDGVTVCSYCPRNMTCEWSMMRSHTMERSRCGGIGKGKLIE